jgi:hypothetical protein
MRSWHVLHCLAASAVLFGCSSDNSGSSPSGNGGKAQSTGGGSGGSGQGATRPAARRARVEALLAAPRVQVDKPQAAVLERVAA